MLFTLLAAASLLPGAEPKSPDTNLVFRNATIYDGSGKPAFKGDVHVKGDKIAAVGVVGKVPVGTGGCGARQALHFSFSNSSTACVAFI